jgi:hypothetical protein
VTKAGDVLVTTMNEVRTVVDQTGGHLGSTGVDRLRILDPDVIIPSYLAAALCGPWNDRLQTGSSVQRAPIRDLEVPLIPAEHQAKIVRALDQIGALRGLSSQLDKQASRAMDAILQALRYNVHLESPVTPEAAGPRAVGGHRHDASKHSEGTA